MLNKIILMGRLTRDPELRRTESGTAVCSFSIAVDRDFKSKNGEKETDFIDIVSWRATAEFVSKYFTKGKEIIVTGEMQSRKWTDKDGNNRISWEIQNCHAEFCGSAKATNDTAQNTTVQPAGNFSTLEDDGTPLPF